MVKFHNGKQGELGFGGQEVKYNFVADHILGIGFWDWIRIRTPTERNWESYGSSDKRAIDDQTKVQQSMGQMNDDHFINEPSPFIWASTQLPLNTY
jgi:hypothetical protein